MDLKENNRDLFLFSTVGGSMFPFIRWREYVIVKKVPAEDLQLGDVVVYREEGRHPVCHRIVSLENRNGKRWFCTRGDQREEDDGQVSAESIIGKVIAVRKKYGLLEPSSPEWPSCSDPREHRWSRGLFKLKNLIKKAVLFIRPKRN
jgi:signal peptidase I